MIKILTLVTFVFISFCATAQIKKGTLLVGGQISTGKSEMKSPGITPALQPYNPYNFSKYGIFGVSIGKAIKDDRIIGLIFNTSIFKQNTNLSPTEASSSKNYINEACVFYRQYKKLGKDIYFFGQANASFSFGKSYNKFTNPASNFTTKQIGGSLSIAPGLAYAISKKFHLELTMQNLVAVQKNSSRQEFADPAIQIFKSESYTINSSLSNGVLSNIGIGFRLIL